MRFANALRSAAVVTVGMIVGGCAVRVRPATVTYTPPEVVITHPFVDVRVSRPVIVEERRDIVVNRPIVVEKKTVVVEKKPTVVVENGHHDNGNHNGNDKMSDPTARHDNGNHYGQDKDKDKKGVAKSE